MVVTLGCVFCLNLGRVAGIVIADVRADTTTALCEDSCSFANDGMCDEPGAVSCRSMHAVLCSAFQYLNLGKLLASRMLL